MAKVDMWLPIGSVVRLAGGEKPVMIAGFMVRDGETGSSWDYLGYPYPEGRRDGEDLFFNKEQVEAIAQVGFLDAEGCAYQAFLEVSRTALNQKGAHS